MTCFPKTVCARCAHFDPQPCGDNPWTLHVARTDFERTHVPCRPAHGYLLDRLGDSTVLAPGTRLTWTWIHADQPVGAVYHCAFFDDLGHLNLLWLANRREGRHRD